MKTINGKDVTKEDVKILRDLFGHGQFRIVISKTREIANVQVLDRNGEWFTYCTDLFLLLNIVKSTGFWKYITENSFYCFVYDTKISRILTSKEAR